MKIKEDEAKLFASVINDNRCVIRAYILNRLDEYMNFVKAENEKANNKKRKSKNSREAII